MNDIINYEWKDIDELKSIQKFFNVEEENFQKGYIFAQLLVSGVSGIKSYEQAFGVDKSVATSRAGGFTTRKWVKELIRSIKVDDDTLYIGEVKRIIRRGMEIVTNPQSSNRDVTEAMKALQPYIKQQTQKVEAEIKISDSINPTESIMEKMQNHINLLSDNGKMINQSGDIIDVEEVI